MENFLTCNSKRILWADITKGICILLVIIGHQLPKTTLKNFIYLFHLPTFIFVSGFLCRDRSTIKILIKKDILFTYIYYVFYSLLWILFVIILNNVLLSQKLLIKILLTIISSVNYNSLINVGVSWYLLFLVNIKILFYICNKMINERIVILLFSFLLYTINYITLNNNNSLPFCISQVLGAFCFFCLGKYCNEIYDQLNINYVAKSKLFIFSIILLITIFPINYILHGSLNVGNNFYSNYFVIIFAIMGIISVVALSISVSEISFFSVPLIFLGKISLHLMGLHSLIRVLFHQLFINFNINIYIKNLFISLLTLIICIPLSCLMEKIIGYLKIVIFNYFDINTRNINHIIKK